MIHRPDLLSSGSPKGLEVWQLTSESAPSCHIYMEAQIFTPDSRHFLLHRSARPHGSDSEDPEHQYLLCDAATGALTPVTTETGATSPSLSPDGRYFYYFITRSGQYSSRLGERVTLRRRNLDGSDPVDILVLDGFLPGTRFRPSRLYPLSTISSDGERLAISCFLGDGTQEGAPWGLWVIDLATGESTLPLHSPRWSNMHTQYCRSREADARHDLLVQEDHGAICDANGHRQRVEITTHGIDIHVVRDNGQRLRSLPWGRTAEERCQGHQCWRGESEWAITSTLTQSADPDAPIGHLIESQAIPFTDDRGSQLGGIRNRLCRSGEERYYSHFATDRAGKRLIADCMENLGDFARSQTVSPHDAIYLMQLGKPGSEAASQPRFLLRPQTSWRGGAHSHPFLSPDGKTAFFNSDESGVMQAYMIRNLPQGDSQK